MRSRRLNAIKPQCGIVGGREQIGIVQDVCREYGGGVGRPRHIIQLRRLKQVEGGVREVADGEVEQHLFVRQHRMIHHDDWIGAGDDADQFDRPVVQRELGEDHRRGFEKVIAGLRRRENEIGRGRRVRGL